MKKVVIITGASSGIGEASVKYFAERNWLVFAASRKPIQGKQWADNVRPIVLDVTQPNAIKESFESIFAETQRIDALINNAGFGAFGAFELSTDAERKSVFDVNVWGVMNTIAEVLPYFRKQKNGVIVNISSIGGLMTYPLFSIYHSSKWALEGFSESLHFELEPLGIRVKIVEPGATQTAFNTSSLLEFRNTTITDYDTYTNKLRAMKDKSFEDAISPEKVAKTIYFATLEQNNNRIRYVVGNSRSTTLARLRKILPTNWFISLIKNRFKAQ